MIIFYFFVRLFVYLKHKHGQNENQINELKKFHQNMLRDERGQQSPRPQYS